MADALSLTGVVECLQQELGIVSPGTKAIIFEPGYFRTQVFNDNNIKHTEVTVQDYTNLDAACRQYERSIYGNEPGDPRKAVECMIDIVKGEGFARGKPMPPRMPLGTDGLKVMRDKCQATMKLCDEWEEFITSTDLAKV